MIPDPGTIFTPGLLLYVTLILAVSLAVLARGYVGARRWDAAWKQRWEQRHGTSLESLRRRQLQGTVALKVVEVVLGVLLVLGLGLALWVTTMVPGSDREPLLLDVAIVLCVAPLVALIFFDLMRRLTKYKITRLNELLSQNRRSAGLS